MQMQINLQAQCLVSGGTVNFGTRGLLNSVTNITGTFTVRCNRTVAYRVILGTGLNSATTTARRMKHPSAAAYINYSLFRNAARTQNWGDTVATSVAATGNGAAQTRTVYGRVPVQATPQAGTYADSVLITVTY